MFVYFLKSAFNPQDGVNCGARAKAGEEQAVWLSSARSPALTALMKHTAPLLLLWRCEYPSVHRKNDRKMFPVFLLKLNFFLKLTFWIQCCFLDVSYTNPEGGLKWQKSI